MRDKQCWFHFLYKIWYLNNILKLLIVGLLIISCKDSSRSDKLFELVASSQTGVTFSNDITESQEFNIINYQDFYSGGGVSIGDINNDGLPDIFFTGNMVQNRLYLNKGNLQFEDITEQAGLIETDYTWATGSTMIDINNDGWLDIYVSFSGLVSADQRRNKLWINQKDNTFKNEAMAYGIDDPGYAVNAHFFDYDLDGDLDMYLVNQGPEKNPNFNQAISRDIPNEFCGDKLFRNDSLYFTDVTLEAGIYSSLIGFGHGAAIGDVNADGWEDIYVCNDFYEHDYLYINNQDGTFSEVLKASMAHTSHFSMGNDMADFNNNGLLDILVLDMVPEDNRRQKSMLSGMNAGLFWRTYHQGFHYQYMYNTLQLNQGNTTFSDIGHMAGISNTDWSWGPLLADFDGDGHKDLFVSNGLRKDIRNRDWGKIYNEMLSIAGTYEVFSPQQWDYILKSLPSEKIPNYIFRNNGDLTFSNMTDKWGMNTPSFSNGAAYGDLDNDGDLDLVVNNVDAPAFIYENTSDRHADYNFLKIKLIGPDENKMALGTKVYITHFSGIRQMHQHYVSRGYRSSMDPALIFGCGSDTVIMKVEVVWPDGTLSVYKEVPANRELLIDYDEISRKNRPIRQKDIFTIFESSPIQLKPSYRHRDNFFDPYQYQPLLPYRLSELGPFIGVTDVNNDGLDDFYVGGAKGMQGQLFLQLRDGSFVASIQPFMADDRQYEDMGLLFLDVDMDGDQDLYVVSGGYEFEAGDTLLQDRLYINDGKGNFEKSVDALPSFLTSGGRVISGDYDQDGDLDLFVCGRQVPKKYPLPANSYILNNDNGVFTDVTNDVAPELLGLGMVTDAVWTDYDNDGDLDLMVVGEWMQITLFENIEGKFIKSSAVAGLDQSSGWWNCIKAYDFDGDGDDDYVVGNLGLNYRYKTSLEFPFQVFSSDFNDDGRQGIVLAYYENGILYPQENLEKSLIQMPEIGEKVKSHDQFSVMTLTDVYGREALDSAVHYKAHTFQTSYVENLGGGRFKMTALPTMAQISNTNAILLDDFNQDGFQDILIAGNLHSSEEQTVRLDGGMGLLLTGDGKGNFQPIPPFKSGFYASGDVKDMGMISIGDSNYLMISRNSDGLLFFKIAAVAQPLVK